MEQIVNAILNKKYSKYLHFDKFVQPKIYTEFILDFDTLREYISSNKYLPIPSIQRSEKTPKYRSINKIVKDYKFQTPFMLK
jgi:hypothetical protein